MDGRAWSQWYIWLLFLRIIVIMFSIISYKIFLHLIWLWIYLIHSHADLSKTYSIMNYFDKFYLPRKSLFLHSASLTPDMKSFNFYYQLSLQFFVNNQVPNGSDSQWTTVLMSNGGLRRLVLFKNFTSVAFLFSIRVCFGRNILYKHIALLFS